MNSAATKWKFHRLGYLCSYNFGANINAMKYKGILLSGNSGGQKLHLNEYELHAWVTYVTGTNTRACRACIKKADKSRLRIKIC